MAKDDLPEWFPGWYAGLTPAQRKEFDLEVAKRAVDNKPVSAKWPVDYINQDTGKTYSAPHEEAAEVLSALRPRNILVKGGEGSGKSAFGIKKDLDRLRGGMSGILVSPDLPHFKKSLWPELRRWIPWDCVVKKHQHRQRHDWEPAGFFVLVFKSEVGGFSTLYCGGIDDPAGWEGPNVHFAHFDEARRKRDADALKVLSGRVRLVGPKGEPPQLWLTTTPRKHWLFDYFGPLKKNDPLADFKASARVLTLLTEDNIRNLDQDYIKERGASLSEKEKRILLYAEWEDEEDVKRFLESMSWWDGCEEALPPLTQREPMVLAMDAAVTNDTFAVVGVTRHPLRPSDSVAVRYAKNWEADGKKIDFRGPEEEVRRLCLAYNVVQICYDAYQLHDMSSRLERDGVAWMNEFSQGGARLEADKQLLDLIMARRLAHDGSHTTLREHVDNADAKIDGDTKKLRIVKRSAAEKVDLTVAMSMASSECLRLSISA